MMMKTRRWIMTATITTISLGLLAALALTSCQSTKKDNNKVHVDAYINVSSGCQAATVDLLKQLAAQYPDRVALTITDFGGDGFRKWQEAGLSCMTILFDGTPAVVFDAPGGAVPVVFQMPAGISWTHEDLERAFAAAAVGKLRAATELEIQAANTPKKYAVKFTAQESRDLASNKIKFQLLANGKAVAEITEKDGDKSAKDRAGKAAKALSDWAANPVLIGDLKMEATAPGRVSIIAAGAPALTATETDATAAGETDTKKLASKWMSGIKSAMLTAGEAGAEKKTGARANPSQELADAGAPPPPEMLFGGARMKHAAALLQAGAGSSGSGDPFTGAAASTSASTPTLMTTPTPTVAAAALAQPKGLSSAAIAGLLHNHAASGVHHHHL